jgi:hypothetical protein
MNDENYYFTNASTALPWDSSKVIKLKCINLNFENSDHIPVRIEFKLKK